MLDCLWRSDFYKTDLLFFFFFSWLKYLCNILFNFYFSRIADYLKTGFFYLFFYFFIVGQKEGMRDLCFELFGISIQQCSRMHKVHILRSSGSLNPLWIDIFVANNVMFQKKKKNFVVLVSYRKDLNYCLGNAMNKDDLLS